MFVRSGSVKTLEESLAQENAHPENVEQHSRATTKLQLVVISPHLSVDCGFNNDFTLFSLILKQNMLSEANFFSYIKNVYYKRLKIKIDFIFSS